jgi:hypothetical protein
MTAGASDKTVTLPITPNANDFIEVCKADSGAGNVIIDGNGKNINGANTKTITVQYTAISLQYNGTEWRIK